MAKLLRMANAAVNAGANAMAALANNGYLRIYDGTQAATGDTAVGAQVLIAECRMGANYGERGDRRRRGKQRGNPNLVPTSPVRRHDAPVGRYRRSERMRSQPWGGDYSSRNSGEHHSLHPYGDKMNKPRLWWVGDEEVSE